jgi:UDP-N-acetylmuramate--alanine ligase
MHKPKNSLRVEAQKDKRIHFVGVGGVGMGGIAEVLLNLRYQVSGSDLHENRITRHLVALGAQVALGHDARHIEGADAVVVSTAVEGDNPRLWLRPLARPGAAACGDAGRTHVVAPGIAKRVRRQDQTVSLIASLLAEGGLDPTFVIGVPQ